MYTVGMQKDGPQYWLITEVPTAPLCFEHPRPLGAPLNGSPFARRRKANWGLALDDAAGDATWPEQTLVPFTGEVWRGWQVYYTFPFRLPQVHLPILAIRSMCVYVCTPAAHLHFRLGNQGSHIADVPASANEHGGYERNPLLRLLSSI